MPGTVALYSINHIRLPITMQWTVTVLTRVLLAVYWSMLVTTILPLLYLPHIVSAQGKFNLYDEFRVRTSIPVPGGYAELFNCGHYPSPNNTINLTDIGKEGINCGPRMMLLPQKLMTRIAKEGECVSPLDCQDTTFVDNKQDPMTEPQICTLQQIGESKDECEHFMLGYTPDDYLIKKKQDCDVAFCPPFDYTTEGVTASIPPGTVVLVTNTTKVIEVGADATELSCTLTSSSPIPQPHSIGGGQISRISVEELVEDQLVRVDCKVVGGVGAVCSVYFFIGRKELKVNCTAPTGSKCIVPAWINISQGDIVEKDVVEKGVVQCSLKTPMQLCFPIQTDAAIESKEEVCGKPSSGGGSTGGQGEGGLSAGTQIAIAAAVIMLIALIGAIIIAYMVALKKQQQKVEEALLKLKSAKEEEAPPVGIDESKPMWKKSSNLQQQYLRKEREMQKAKEEAAKVKKKLKPIDPKRLAGLKGGGSREKKGGEDDVSGVDESVASASF